MRTNNNNNNEHIKKMHEKQNAAVKALAEALIAAGHSAVVQHEQFTDRDSIYRVDGEAIYVHFDEKRSGTAYYRHGTGTLYCTVGDYGEKRVFNETGPKRTDFDYPAIVREIENRISERLEAAAAKAKHKEEKAKTDTLLETINANLGQRLYLRHDAMGFFLRLPNVDTATLVKICKAALEAVES